MQAYLGGQPVNLTIPLVDSGGSVISATAVSYRVIDQSETELIAKTTLSSFVEGDEEVVITISDAVNTLSLNELRGLRVVELYVTTEIGVIKIEYGYFVEADEVLVEGVNSFMGYNGALFVAGEVANIPGWSNAEKKDRIAALITARRNIGRLRFRYVFDDYQDIIDSTVGISDLTAATATQWNTMPTSFREAVRRAQLLEADYILGGDEVGDIRRSGLMSMSVGEAKQFFRPGKTIEGAVCKRAMKELSKYALTRVRTSRS